MSHILPYRRSALPGVYRMLLLPVFQIALLQAAHGGVAISGGGGQISLRTTNLGPYYYDYPVNPNPQPDVQAIEHDIWPYQIHLLDYAHAVISNLTWTVGSSGSFSAWLSTDSNKDRSLDTLHQPLPGQVNAFADWYGSSLSVTGQPYRVSVSGHMSTYSSAWPNPSTASASWILRQVAPSTSTVLSYNVGLTDTDIFGQSLNYNGTALLYPGHLYNFESQCRNATGVVATTWADVWSQMTVIPASTIALSNAVNATIIRGGTGTLGTTVGNSAASGGDNLNYNLAAAVQSGSATLGSVTPGSGSLAPGASRPNPVSATSTNMGLNTIRFNATDPNAWNSPQTIDAALTVLDHAAPTLGTTSADFGRVMKGTLVTAPTTTLSNTLATYRAGLQITNLGGMTGANVGDVIANGGSKVMSAAVDTNSTGSYLASHAIGLSDDQSILGAISLPSQIFTVTGTVVDNRVVTATSADFGVVHAGVPVSKPTTLSTASGDDNHATRVKVANAGPDANGVSVSGASNPTFNDNSVTDTRSVGGTFNTIGTESGTITLTTTGEGLPGESPVNVPVSYTAQVYSGKAQWNLADEGSWGTHANWKDTQVGGPSAGAPGISGSSGDTATFGNVASFSVNVNLDGANPILSALTFNNKLGAYYYVAQGSGGTLTMNNSPSTATIDVTAGGRHQISAPVVLGSSTNITVTKYLDELSIIGPVSPDYSPAERC